MRSVQNVERIMIKMGASDMELAAKYLRTNDVGDEAGEACQRVAAALEARATKSRVRLINSAGVEPPNRGKADRKTIADRGINIATDPDWAGKFDNRGF